MYLSILVPVAEYQNGNTLHFRKNFVLQAAECGRK